MKKMILLLTALCLLLVGCGKEDVKTEATKDAADNTAGQNTSAPAEESVPVVTVNPLPDTTMDNLTDAILAVSLEEGGAYVDDTGKLQMDVTIYTYDKYDLVDISALKEGDTIVTCMGEMEITSLERNDSGTIILNGGLEEGGIELVTDDTGVYFETGFNDVKNWYEVGKATIRVSADFTYYDLSNLEAGEILYYPGSFLIGEVTDYNFTPFNTTIRIENGQIIEMNRVYIP